MFGRAPVNNRTIGEGRGKEGERKGLDKSTYSSYSSSISSIYLIQHE